MPAPSHSTGDVAGIASAAVIVLASIGAALKWLFGWRRDARKTRAEGLQQWEDKLKEREADLDSAVDQRLKKLEGDSAQHAEQSMALRMAFELVAGALRSIDPGNTALRRAEQLLVAAFPLTSIVPPEMSGELGRIDSRQLAADAAARRHTTTND